MASAAPHRGAALLPLGACGADDFHPARHAYETPPPLRVHAAQGGGGVALERFPVAYGGYEYEGWIAYRRGAPPRPQVLVIPNYAGLKQFDKDQAVFLAQVGFVGIAVDIYKEVERYTKADRSPPLHCSRADAAAHMEHAMKFVDHFMTNPGVFRAMLGAYLEHGRRHPAVDASRAAAIGYCFGGTAVLEMVRGGLAVDCVVSFHGVLQATPSRRDMKVNTCKNAHNSRCVVLIENGDLDHFVTPRSLAKFKQEFDAAGVAWRFHNHARTPHGFALAPGCFNNQYAETADRRSTLSMLSLFAEVFPEVQQQPVAVNACGTRLGQAVLPLARL